jgi:hypothetical protein
VIECVKEKEKEEKEEEEKTSRRCERRGEAS